MKIFNLVSSALVVAALALPIAAQPCGAGKGKAGMGDGKGKQHMMWKTLNLTEEQKAKLDKLHDSHQSERAKHKKEMKLVRDNIRVELGKDNPDEKKLKNYAEQTSDLVAGMTQKRLDHLLEVKKILNKEQFETLLNKEWKNGPGMEGSRGARNGCPNGPKCDPENCDKKNCPHTMKCGPRGKGKCKM